MYIQKMLESGIKVGVVIPEVTEERLSTTCFRGTFPARAGNFLHWNSTRSIFRDEEVLKRFLTELNRLWQENDFGVHSLCIKYSTLVGWESTAPLCNYAPEDLEEFKLNRKSSGLRLKASRSDLVAPKTCELTVVFQFKREGINPVAVVRSVYPGRDIGDLKGDVTKREQRIFFDWSHPGEN